MSVFAELESINGLIVGGNRGIGLGLVQSLLRPDFAEPFQATIAHLYVTYRSEVSAELAAIAAGHPDRLTLIQMDITDEAHIAQGIAQIQHQVDRLHLILYCVGFLHESGIQPEKSLQQIQAEHLIRYFQVNSIGAVLLAKHMLPLVKHGDRSVFASISAKVGSIGDNQLGGWYGYRASKAALNMLMRTTAIEYSRKSPKTIVVMLHPGTTDTQLSKPFQRNVLPEKLFSVEKTVAQLLRVIATLHSADSGQFFSWDGSRLPW
jgi:NAD(P)-dependent dehydrogenase (short-subunit alcohol dehydrogenase family)